MVSGRWAAQLTCSILWLATNIMKMGLSMFSVTDLTASHFRLEAGRAIHHLETVAARDGGAKPSCAPLGSPLFGETYLRRVSE